MGNNDEKRVAEFLREFMIFFAVMFFTFIVGIIELLPELSKIDPRLTPWGFTVISIIYFGLLAGIIFSVKYCFWLYEENREFREKGKFGFYFPLIEPLYSRGKILEKFLIVGLFVVFTLLFLVKIGVLT